MSERFESGYLNPASNFDNSSLGVLTFRSESHVAQQRRRDKLRVPPQTHNIDDVPTHLLHVHGQSGLNPNLIQVRSNTNCDLLQDLPPLFSSEMLNFSMNNHVWLGHKDAVLQQEASGGAQSGRSIGLDDVSCSNSSKLAGPQNPCHWKGIGSQQNFDWNVNYANTSGGDVYSQNPLIVGETLPSKLKLNDTSLTASSMYMNPGGYQNVQSSLTNSANAMSSQECSKHYGEINFSSPSFYPNALQEIVSSSAVVAQGYAMASIVQQNNRESSQSAWVDRGNDQVLPTNASHFGGSRLNDTDSWMHRPVDGAINQWNGELGLAGRSRRYLDRVTGESTSRGLSLSLSSHSPSNVAQVDERIGFKNLQSRAGICSASQDSKSIDPGYLCSGSKSSVPNNFHGIVGSSANPHRSIGPLGPFTGYSTILKNSKFLKPAQYLLDEICIVTGSKILKACAMLDRGSREVSTSSSPIDGDGDEVNCRAGSSDVSSFNSSNGAGTEVRMGSSQTYNPEYHEKKAKLLYMQEEVCRRYKQYHQQMQMVVASFESVAGLSSATPYTSLALKAVSKHFRCLKNAISDQIKCITKALGEEFLSSPIGTSKSDSIIPKLRSTDPNLRKQQVGGDRLSIVEAQVPQQPIWRPQRGLPERAVSVLRAWLFDHFLHPYPSDTDKHMLAAQTGLSRNQVSNWFINARVRVWKPMVEEMHALETKGSTDPDQNSNNPKPDNTGNAGCSGEQSSNELMIDAMSEKLPECSPVQHVPNDIRSRDKRSRMEHQFPTSVDGGLMGFVPYHHTGLGAVSLTLGLRHTADHHHQQQEDQHRRHYGDQMIHDFVG